MEIFIKGVPHIPMEEAAGRLGTTPVRVLMLIRQGVMKGCLEEDQWFVEKGSMACFRAYEADPSKPGGCAGSCSPGGCSHRS